MGPTQPLFGAGGGLGGGNGGGKGGGGGPGGVWGLGLGGVRGLLFLSFRFDSLTLGPVTDELPLELRCFRFRFFFSFSLSSRLPRLLFSLGETVLLSLFFFLSLLTGLSGAASSASASGSGPFFDGSALDLLANRNGFAGSPDFLSGSLLVGFGAGTWEFSTNATLPFALAGVSIGGAFGGVGPGWELKGPLGWMMMVGWSHSAWALSLGLMGSFRCGLSPLMAWIVQVGYQQSSFSTGLLLQRWGPLT